MNFRVLSKLFIRKNVSFTIKNNLIKRCVFDVQLKKSFCTSTIEKSIYLIDNEKQNNCSKLDVNKYTERSCTCGELRREHVGRKVTLCGWLEFQRMNTFVVVRDAYGQTQLLIREDDLNLKKLIETLPYESVIKIEGSVLARPKEMINEAQATGEIEVLIEDFQILNKSKSMLPFNIREFQKGKEALRMQYRYLDMRFAEMQRNLRVRSQVMMDIRNFLTKQAGFIEVETPTLFKATPGGAQEFVVPTRFPGLFYSLVQSPQQFKQMLMGGAVDRYSNNIFRYFQVARCYRDEGARPDRQPEFTQLDLELSFTNRDEIMVLIEDLCHNFWPNFAPALPKRFKRITYEEAVELYGTDKPDARYGFTLRNVRGCFEKSTDDFACYVLVFPKKYDLLSKSVKERMSALSKQYPGCRLMQTRFSHKENFIARVEKACERKLVEELRFETDSVVFLAWGNKSDTMKLLGKIRVDYVNLLRENGFGVILNEMNMLWVVDFPLFEEGDVPGELKSVHHPFTAPHPDDLDLLRESPLKMRSLAYDLVLNGEEVGGGSIRIHNANLQEEILKMLNINTDSLQHMLDMLSSGCPPHGGIALGMDRLLAVLLNTPSIRDVIAFPKTFEGKDPLSGAPSPLTENDKEIYHITPTYSKNKI